MNHSPIANFQSLHNSRWRGPVVSAPRDTGIRALAATVVLAGLLFQASTAQAASRIDWPQFLGPNRDGTLPGARISTAWPKEGPRVVWRTPGGTGFASPALAGGKLVVFDRAADRMRLRCLDAATGKVLWELGHPTSFSPMVGGADGPLATPLIASNQVYAMSPEGVLVCASMESGKQVWVYDAAKALGARQGFFGLAPSPILVGGNPVFCVGGTGGAAMVSLDHATGNLLWKAVNDEAGYASPILLAPATPQAGEHHPPRLALFLRTGLAVLDGNSGGTLAQLRRRSRDHASVNAATPVQVDDRRVFLTASYGTGAALVDLGEATPKVVWESDEALSAHYATPVRSGKFLYGLHGRTDFPPGPSLRCVEWATGKVRWSEDGFGAATLLLLGDNLLVLKESGELVAGPVSENGFRPIARAQVTGSGMLTYPAFDGERLYIRGKSDVVCLDVSPGTP